MASELGGGSVVDNGSSAPLRCPQQAARPHGVACLACRRVKMRCIITGDASNKCERCTRLRKDCVFENHRRGLWKRNRQTETGSTNKTGRRSLQKSDSAPERAHATETNTRAFPDIPAIVRAADSQHCFDRQHTFDAPRPPGVSPPTLRQQSSASLSGSAEQSPGREEKVPRFNVAAFVTSDVDAGDLAVDVALDTQRRIMEGESTSAKSLTSSDDRDKSWQELDPIHMKLLSRPAAEVLFEGFMKHFNSLAGFLDPALYTFSYTREASNLLFTAALAIAATVFRPELYRSLKQHQENLLGKALLACDAAVENVWTMCLLYYWKDVGDRRGYNLVGFAIQLAKSAEWNKTRRPRSLSQVEKSVPTQMEMEVHARQRRDKHLAWLLLGALDRTTSMFTNRPLTRPPLTDVSTSRSWIDSEPESYTWGCTRHVAGYEMTAISRQLYDFVLRTEAGSSDTHDDGSFPSSNLVELQKLTKKFNDDMDAWQAYWIPEFTRVAPLQQQSQVTFYGSYLKLYFNSILLHRSLAENGDDLNDPTVIQTLSTCYFSAMSVLIEARNFGKLDLLYYFWDSAHLTSAYAAMMLLKVLNLSSALPETAASDALEVLTGLLVAYTNTAQAIAWRPEGQARTVESDKVPVANGLEAQARLLRSIVATINARFDVAASSAARGVSYVSAPTPPPWSHMQAELGADSAADMTVSGGQSTGEGPEGSARDRSVDIAMTQLVGDMDFSLDTSYMDAKFLDAGLLGWDELGIFADDK